MKFFYLSTLENSDGLFEIHDRDCPNIPNTYHREYLGPFNNEFEAFRLAMKSEPAITLCTECCKSENNSFKATVNFK